MLRLRQPRPDEAGALTALCLRSKAMHGYDDVFMAACGEELTVDLRKPGGRFMVADEDGVTVGVAEISVEGDAAELQKLFVEPSRVGGGIGRKLFGWARDEAAALGAACMMIDSDPGAREFYLAMGASAIGTSSSGSIPGRFLPRLRLDLRRCAT